MSSALLKLETYKNAAASRDAGASVPGCSAQFPAVGHGADAAVLLFLHHIDHVEEAVGFGVLTMAQSHERLREVLRRRERRCWGERGCESRLESSPEVHQVNESR